MSSQPPPIETEEQETADFLATQFVFGNGERPTVGLDVLVTKVAVDFVGLTSEAGDNCVKRNLDALREATGVDAICIALLDGERKLIERCGRVDRAGRAVRSAGHERRRRGTPAGADRQARAPAARRDPLYPADPAVIAPGTFPAMSGSTPSPPKPVVFVGLRSFKPTEVRGWEAHGGTVTLETAGGVLSGSFDLRMQLVDGTDTLTMTGTFAAVRVVPDTAGCLTRLRRNY